MTRLEDALRERKRREIKGSPDFYKPFDKETARLLTNHYKGNLRLSLSGEPLRELYSHSGVLVALGYSRVVVGHYGAYVELLGEHFQVTLKKKYDSTPSRTPSYWWLHPLGMPHLKVYFQNRRTRYADYKPGMYYIDPRELYNSDGIPLSD